MNVSPKKWARSASLQNYSHVGMQMQILSHPHLRALENPLCLDLGLTPQALCFRLASQA